MQLLRRSSPVGFMVQQRVGLESCLEMAGSEWSAERMLEGRVSRSMIVVAWREDASCSLVNTVVVYGIFNITVYVKMVKRRIILFVCLFLEVLLLFLIGKYRRLPAE